MFFNVVVYCPTLRKVIIVKLSKYLLLTFVGGDGVRSGLLLLQLKFVGMLSLLIFSLFGDFFIDKFSATLLLKFDGEGALLKSCGPIASPDLRLGLA